MNNIENNIKAWIANLNGFENAWSYRGSGVFSLGGQSINPLPSNVYNLSIDNSGQIIYCALNITTDSLIRLPNSKADYILKTMEKFWGSREKYKQFGQVYKRGILLYGRPGNSKTVTINLLFEQVLQNNGIVFFIDDPDIAIAAIQRFRMLEPDRPLILIYEDIDSLFDKYGESALLAVLDGELQFDNVVHVATTNYIDKIPLRLKNRPSRFDEVIEILEPNVDERVLFIRHLMNPIDDKSKILEIVKDTDGFSFSHIKELIISVYLLEKDYQATLDRLKVMMKGD